MDEIKQHLQAEQANIADRLKREMANLKPSDPQFEVTLHRLQLAVERLSEFQVQVFGQVQCPTCWLWHGHQSTLRQERFVLGGTVLTCPTCKYDLKLPA